MSGNSNLEQQTHAVIQNVETQLQISDPSPFSYSAFDMLKAKIAKYVSDLINESVTISKRHRADTISATHVEDASGHLITSTSRRLYRHLGTIGGIILGAALSNILAMSLTAQYKGDRVILFAVLGIVGAFLIALHIAKE